jgi:phospholipid/cholesterol/gamma-HCH transport system substrate-binding protein
VTALRAVVNGWVRAALIATLIASIVVAGYLVRPVHPSHTVIGYFANAVGLYPGDDVKVLGVPVGRIVAIAPRDGDVKITMTVRDGVPIPADARAVVMAPNLLAARFIQLTPAYTGGPRLADGASIDLAATAVPVEWDEVKGELTTLAASLGPAQGTLQGPLSGFVNQAAGTFAGNGKSFHDALRELSQTAGRLSDSRTDLLGTVKNLQILLDALSSSTEQIVAFTGHLASVSQVLADSSSHLDATLATLNRALADIRGFLHDNNSALIGQISKLTDFTKILSDQSDDLEQVLHVTPNAMANFYNIYNPAQGSLSGLVSIPNFANPVQFLCGGTFDTGSTPDNFKRAEICRERMAPVLRRLTMNYPPVLFHPINTITAYKGQVLYDTPATEAKAQTPIAELQWQPAPGTTPAPGAAQTDLTSLLLPPAPSAPPPGTAGPPGPPGPPEPAPAGGPPIPVTSGGGG